MSLFLDCIVVIVVICHDIFQFARFHDGYLKRDNFH